MVKKLDKAKARAKRHARVRNKISGTAECPRLNVFRSSKHIYAQIINDETGVTLCSASQRVSRMSYSTEADSFTTDVFRS